MSSRRGIKTRSGNNDSLNSHTRVFATPFQNGYDTQKVGLFHFSALPVYYDSLLLDIHIKFQQHLYQLECLHKLPESQVLKSLEFRRAPARGCEYTVVTDFGP